MQNYSEETRIISTYRSEFGYPLKHNQEVYSQLDLNSLIRAQQILPISMGGLICLLDEEKRSYLMTQVGKRFSKLQY